MVLAFMEHISGAPTTLSLEVLTMAGRLAREIAVLEHGFRGAAGRGRRGGARERDRHEREVVAQELLAVQRHPVDLGGYYAPDPEKATAVMRPSPTFNAALDTLG